MLQKLIMDRTLGVQASTDPSLLVHLGKRHEQAWITEGLPHSPEVASKYHLRNIGDPRGPRPMGQSCFNETKGVCYSSLCMTNFKLEDNGGRMDTKVFIIYSICTTNVVHQVEPRLKGKIQEIVY